VPVALSIRNLFYQSQLDMVVADDGEMRERKQSEIEAG
jgi:hypothetical protein